MPNVHMIHGFELAGSSIAKNLNLELRASDPITLRNAGRFWYDTEENVLKYTARDNYGDLIIRSIPLTSGGGGTGFDPTAILLAIATEIQNRIAGDNAIASDLEDEVEARGDADTALSGDIADLTQALADEVQARGDADGALTSSIAGVASDLVDEAQARSDADGVLTGALEDEADVRAQTDADLLELINSHQHPHTHPGGGDVDWDALLEMIEDAIEAFKRTLGGAAFLDVGRDSGTVLAGDDLDRSNKMWLKAESILPPKSLCYLTETGGMSLTDSTNIATSKGFLAISPDYALYAADSAYFTLRGDIGVYYIDELGTKFSPGKELFMLNVGGRITDVYPVGLQVIRKIGYSLPDGHVFFSPSMEWIEPGN